MHCWIVVTAEYLTMEMEKKKKKLPVELKKKKKERNERYKKDCMIHRIGNALVLLTTARVKPR